MTRNVLLTLLLITTLTGAIAADAFGEERRQNFDADPQWDAVNHRAATPQPQTVEQDFGYSATQHAGGATPGEIGGMLTPTAEACYYAKAIELVTLDDRLTASGTFASTGRQFHVLVGFFNADTLNEWRTPNSLVLRLYGRGDVFYAYVEYCTSRWRAGGDNPGGFATITDPDTGRAELRGFATGVPHRWALEYDPGGAGGDGAITVTIDGETAVCVLDPGHKADGAVFNRCGLLNIPKHYDQGGEVWLDDVTINGQTEDFDRDPGWDAHRNRATFTTHNVRPRFDFGFSPTQFAGGKSRGELGGVVFRGDCRRADRLAYYGDRLDTLTLDKPLRAEGRVALVRGVSDSTVLIGFFHAQDSMVVSDDQSSGWPVNFIGAAVEGPSSEGFLIYPAYRVPGGSGALARAENPPHILPDGSAARWEFDYSPEGSGRIELSFGDQAVRLDLGSGHRDKPARFNRFGIVTTWIDGNAQHIYFDDLVYTCAQE